jgi:UDP-2,3-diacylglucosamine hydrolase
VLFLHGDELATLDRSYQRFRRVVRSGPVRALAGALPGPVTQAVARGLRSRSRRAVAAKNVLSVELQADAAEAWSRRHAAGALVCGHKHEFRDRQLPGGARWIVLDAFGGPRDVLRVDADGTLAPLASGAASGGPRRVEGP